MLKSCLQCKLVEYTDKDSDALESVQRRGARFIFGDYEWDSNVTDMLKRLNWVELSERRRLANATLAHNWQKRSFLFLAICTNVSY